MTPEARWKRRSRLKCHSRKSVRFLEGLDREKEGKDLDALERANYAKERLEREQRQPQGG